MSHSPAELAELVKDVVDLDHSNKVDGDVKHLHNAAVAVCKELGMDDNALNVTHVMDLLKEHVSAPSRAYPKMFYRDQRPKNFAGHCEYNPLHDNWSTVVHNEEEKEELGDGWREESKKKEDKSDERKRRPS